VKKIAAKRLALLARSPKNSLSGSEEWWPYPLPKVGLIRVINSFYKIEHDLQASFHS